MRERFTEEVRCRVKTAWKRQIEDLADRMGLKVPDVMRQALRVYLETNLGKPAPLDPSESCSEREHRGASAPEPQPAASASPPQPAEAFSPE
jgi:hypothetical protein